VPPPISSAPLQLSACRHQTPLQLLQQLLQQAAAAPPLLPLQPPLLLAELLRAACPTVGRRGAKRARRQQQTQPQALQVLQVLQRRQHLRSSFARTWQQYQRRIAARQTRASSLQLRLLLRLLLCRLHLPPLRNSQALAHTTRHPPPPPPPPRASWPQQMRVAVAAWGRGGVSRSGGQGALPSRLPCCSPPRPSARRLRARIRISICMYIHTNIILRLTYISACTYTDIYEYYMHICAAHSRGIRQGAAYACVDTRIRQRMSAYEEGIRRGVWRAGGCQPCQQR
jgi:hypothetical protein